MDNLPTSALGVMRMMPSKAKEVAQFSKQIIESVKQGDANPLEVLVMLRSLEAVSELVREEIGDEILTAAEKNSEKKFEAFGAFIEKTELGTKYDYGTSKDTVYERLQADANTAKSRLDERTAFLRGLKSEMTIVDELTGEVVTLRPPQKKSKSGVKVYLR
jgi:hypothetical protein